MRATCSRLAARAHRGPACFPARAACPGPATTAFSAGPSHRLALNAMVRRIRTLQHGPDVGGFWRHFECLTVFSLFLFFPPPDPGDPISGLLPLLPQVASRVGVPVSVPSRHASEAIERVAGAVCRMRLGACVQATGDAGDATLAARAPGAHVASRVPATSGRWP